MPFETTSTFSVDASRIAAPRHIPIPRRERDRVNDRFKSSMSDLTPDLPFILCSPLINPILTMPHDQTGGHSVAGGVSDSNTDAAVGHLYEVVVVAPDLGRRAHLADDLDVIERDVASRQHRKLKLARQGQLFGLASVIDFDLLQATRFSDHLFDQPGVFDGERCRATDAHQQLFVLARERQVAQRDPNEMKPSNSSFEARGISNVAFTSRSASISSSIMSLLLIRLD